MSKIKKVRIDIKRDKQSGVDGIVTIDGEEYARIWGHDYLRVLGEAVGYARSVSSEWESGEPW